MKRRQFPLACAALIVAGPALLLAREPIVGLPCEGCDAVFDGLPSKLAAEATIAGTNEPGERMQLSGIVRDARGRPRAGVIVYAYHTNAQGIYPRDARLAGRAAERHGALRGWVQTDAAGRYAFATIRPAGYPKSDLPEHVHLHILEPGRATYYIDDVLFSDDPRLTAKQRRSLDSGRGGSGIATPTRTAAGWAVTRDIVLGQGIGGYPG